MSVTCRPTWSAEARQQMRKLDHSSIFFLIAGSARSGAYRDCHVCAVPYGITGSWEELCAATVKF